MTKTISPDWRSLEETYEGTLNPNPHQHRPDAIEQAEALMKELTQLLSGACLTIVELGGEEAMGPGVRQWWKSQPAAIEASARKILLELPDSDIEVLNAYYKAHGVLPTGGKS